MDVVVLSCLKISDSHTTEMAAVLMPHFLPPIQDQTQLQQAKHWQFSWQQFSKHLAQDLQQIERGFLHNHGPSVDLPDHGGINKEFHLRLLIDQNFKFSSKIDIRQGILGADGYSSFNGTMFMIYHGPNDGCSNLFDISS